MSWRGALTNRLGPSGVCAMQWVDSTNLEDSVKAKAPAKYHEAWKTLCDAHGVLVPGGFGKRGIEGMVVAANWARVGKKPYLGL